MRFVALLPCLITSTVHATCRLDVSVSGIVRALEFEATASLDELGSLAHEFWAGFEGTVQGETCGFGNVSCLEMRLLTSLVEKKMECGVSCEVVGKRGRHRADSKRIIAIGFEGIAQHNRSPNVLFAETKVAAAALTIDCDMVIWSIDEEPLAVADQKAETVYFIANGIQVPPRIVERRGISRRAMPSLPSRVQETPKETTETGSLSVVVAVCSSRATSYVEEAAVMLYSLVSRSSLHITLFAITDSTSRELLETLYLPRLQVLNFGVIWLELSTQSDALEAALGTGYLTCSTQALFAATQSLPHREALVVDTDLIFMSDVFELIVRAREVDAIAVGVSEHGACADSTGSYYPHYSGLRYVGETGMNSGLVYWRNVTEISAVIQSFDDAIHQYGPNSFPLADQDLLNVALADRNASTTLSCVFNYRADFVAFDAHECDRCSAFPKVIHGNRRAFHPDSVYYEPAFAKIYQLECSNAGFSCQGKRYVY